MPPARLDARAAVTPVVRIEDIDFLPHRLVVRRGTLVTWRFLDPQVEHNVTSTGSRRFRSSPDKMTGTYRVTFRRSGTYTYVCTLHINMKARVVVR
jgi:plastocyanin